MDSPSYSNALDDEKDVRKYFVYFPRLYEHQGRMVIIVKDLD